MLEVKMCTGNKRLQGKVIIILSAQEESRFIDIILTKKEEKYTGE